MANNIPNNRNKGYQRKNFQFGNKREELKRARQNATLDDALKEIEKVKLNKSPSLSLDYFPIDKLPDEVFELTFLKKLYCRETQFSEIPAKIELLSNLETLELYGNKLTSLPKELFNLKKLVNLNVQNNHIESLPKEIGLLENLETILFKKNSIKDLPTEFSNLKKLQRFDFSDNSLTEFPIELCNLPDLISVDLENNKISELPQKALNLIRLGHKFNKSPELDLRRNNIKLDITFLFDITKPTRILSAYFKIEESILDRFKTEPAKVFEFIAKSEENETENKPLLECRVVLIGQGNAGKTSLRQRLLNKKFEDRGKTEGIEIDGKYIDINNKKVWMNIWDFGGQEVYHTTHKFFFRERCVYVLVVDVRAGMEKFIVKYWLRQIKDLAKENAPLIIVANKAELKNSTKIDKNYENTYQNLMDECKEIYPQIKAVHYVSTKMPLNVNKVEEDISNAIESELPEVFTPYPPYYVQTRNLLKNNYQFDNFISKEDFEDKLSNEAKADRNLVDILDALGVICKFESNENTVDAELEEMYVLNPEWITKGVYKILSSYKLGENKGKVLFRDIESILNGTKYEGKHRYIVKLMQKFKLCFQIFEQQEHFIIFPTWLPLEKGSFTEFNDDNTCGIKYQYKDDSLIEQIITTFIVDNYDSKHTIWRRGMLMRKKNNRALIEADVINETIQIKIDGERQIRESWLEEIKEYFEKYHFNNDIEVTQDFIEVVNGEEVLFTKDEHTELKKLSEEIKLLNSSLVKLTSENQQANSSFNDAKNKIEKIKPLKTGIELYEKLLPIEIEKSKIDGFADERTITYEKFIISIFVVLCFGWVLYYVENREWFEGNFTKIEPLLALVLPIVFIGLTLLFYAWKRNWFSMENLPEILTNFITKRLYLKHPNLLETHKKYFEELEELKPQIIKAKNELAD